ncbi:Polyketide cyclase / dehydrase and lipid transport [Maioricimonas rarisocia]|uniref:Polyketide cyclase / dehydrase and lipid transport n=1 Tax=Maioricimonas rarisocia TaxID=2528026 RepID=A0A517ZDB9_9PLAN|nr:SRPBCC family protein [Maioricimonas rarisocia]QDU40467.1 Polyketide cyclase / dehydrase and lipid transport [Maioricimonas rarisocia]
MTETKPTRSVRRILASTLGVVACLILVLLLVVATRPDTFSVSRSATIPAPAADVFPYINDLQKWRAWSPYEQLDSEMQREYSASTAGAGASYRWVGNSQAGVGRISVTESLPHEHVRLVLAMEKPFACSNDVEFVFEPGEQTGDTVVTWTMSGKLGFLPKLMHLVFDIDGMVGDQFEEGLTNLNAVVVENQTESASDAATDEQQSITGSGRSHDVDVVPSAGPGSDNRAS